MPYTVYYSMCSAYLTMHRDIITLPRSCYAGIAYKLQFCNLGAALRLFSKAPRKVPAGPRGARERAGQVAVQDLARSPRMHVEGRGKSA